MLNVGPLELLVVLAVALVVVGPERLPELARSVGRVLRQFREVQEEVRDEVRDMVSSGVDDEMRQAATEFRKATGGIKRATDVKGAVRRAQRNIREQTAAAPKRTTPAADEAGEAGGAPADRLLEDASADQPAPARPVPPAAPPASPAEATGPTEPTEPAEQPAPETPSGA